MVKKRKARYQVKKKSTVVEIEKNEKRTVEEKFYWVRVIVAIVTALFGVFVFNLRGWWMLLYLVGFLLIWPFIQSFLIFRLPYKKGQWDWKQILKTGVGAFFFIFMLISTASFTLLTYNDYKDQVNNPANVFDIIIEGDTAYVADGENGLLIIDMTNYNNRDLLGSYRISGISAQFIEKEGNLIYLVDNERSLSILDITDPENIVKVGEFPFPNSVNDVFLNDSKLYLATENAGLSVIDVSTASSPSEILQYGENHTIAGLELYENNIIYSDITEEEFVIANISNINEPTVISSISLFNDTFNDIEIKDEYVYLSTSKQGLMIYNISEINTPVLVQSFNFTSNPGDKLAIFGENCFYSTENGPIYFIDISDITDLTGKNYTSYDSLGQPNEFQVVGDYLYIADGVRGIDRVYIPDPGPSPESNDSSSGRRTVPFGWVGIIFAMTLIPLLVFKRRQEIVKKSP